MRRKEKINKLIFCLGLFLILGTTLFSIYFIYNKYQDKKKTEILIETIFNNSTTNPEIENSKLSENKINLSNDFLGYIEFPNYGVKRLIATGTEEKILDQGLVGTLATSAMLDDEFGNIILAGHSTSNIFQKLHYMKIGEQIIIVSHRKTYIYKITEKHTIYDTDMSYFKQITDKKQLTLITCKNDSSKRLIVVAELRG